MGISSPCAMCGGGRRMEGIEEGRPASRGVRGDRAGLLGRLGQAAGGPKRATGMDGPSWVSPSVFYFS